MSYLTPPTSLPSIQVAGRVFTDLKNLIHLVTAVDAANSRGTFRDQNNTAGYAVPANFQLRILAVRAKSSSAVANSFLAIGYADNDVGLKSATAFTNLKTPGAAGATAVAELQTTTNSPASVAECLFNFVVPAGKYPCVDGSGGATLAYIELYGYLEAV